MDYVWAQIDRLIPENLRDGTPDERRVARLTALLALLLAFNGPPYVLVYLALGLKTAAMQVCVATIWVGGAIWTQRRMKSSTLAGQQVLSGLCWILVAVALATGGHNAPGIVWMTLLPALAVMLLGTRWGLIWAVLSTSIVAGFGIASQLGIEPESQLDPAYESINFIATAPIVLMLQFAAVMAFDNVKTQMARDLDKARGEALKAHERARVVLDNVAQGLVLLDRQGNLAGEHSAAMERWFATPESGQPIWAWIEPIDADTATWLELGWDAVTDAFMPMSIVLDQLPKTVQVGQRTLSLSYQPLGDDPDEFEQLLLVATDITEQLAAKRAEAAQRELISVLAKVHDDRPGFLEFVQNAERLVHQLETGSLDRNTAFRHVHTLKGNASFFGLDTFVGVCHRIETALAEERRAPTADETETITGAWSATTARLDIVLGSRDAVLVRKVAIETLIAEARSGCPGERVAATLRRWTWEPLEARFGRFAEQTRRLADRLDKGPVHIEALDHGLVLEPTALAPFWSAFSHVLRNAVDHGLETPDARQEAGKSTATITLEAHHHDNTFVVALSDDGQGIRWDRIRATAAAAGIPHTTHEDLVAALFYDGVSTAEAVSEVSGRGVGMAALRATTEGLGGTIAVESTPGQGTTFRFTFPAEVVGLPTEPASEAAA